MINISDTENILIQRKKSMPLNMLCNWKSNGNFMYLFIYYSNLLGYTAISLIPTSYHLML